MYSTRFAGLLKNKYSKVILSKGTFPEYPKTEKLPFNASPNKATTTLKNNSIT